MTVEVDTAAELRKLKVDLAEVYEQARDTLHAANLWGNDLILFSHPLKAPFLEMYDSLGAMADEIEAGQWTAVEEKS